MPSTYTTNGGIEKIATGEQSGTWGDTTNTNLDILDRITNGVGTINLSASGAAHTLTTTDGALSDGMYKVLVLTSATQDCTITVAPNTAQKIYFVDNNSGFNCTFTQGTGADVTISNGETGIIYCDGGGSAGAVTAIAEDLSNLLVSTNNLSDVASATTARTNLGVAVGSDVLAYDANLQAFVNAFTLPTSDGTSGQVLSTNGSGTLSFSTASTVSKGFVVGMSIVFGA